jgi:benzoylformate decarboxylase
MGCRRRSALRWHDREKVIALLGDGSSMYAIQGLWTAAQLGLGITFVIAKNRRYEALVNFGRISDCSAPSGPAYPTSTSAHWRGASASKPPPSDHCAALEDALRAAFAIISKPTLVEVAVD